MRINKDTMQVIKTTTAAKITFKKMAVEYRDNADMFTIIDAVIASEQWIWKSRLRTKRLLSPP